MLRVLLMCTEDKASVNIRDRILEICDMETIGNFMGRPVRLGNGFLLFEREGLHLYLDDVDREISQFIDETDIELQGIEPETGYPLDLLIFLSKHRSEKEIRSLTVHPPGNFLSADFGGDEGYLCPSAPREMSASLRSLYKEKKGLGLKDQTTYEVTHHGPHVSSPCFFIEIGSSEDRWGIPVLGEAIARSLLSSSFSDNTYDLPVAIGIGGGHYAPRFTDRALRKKFDFGHMIPDYILSKVDDPSDLIRAAKDATPGAEHIFIHRSSRNEELLKGVEEAADDIGMTVHP